MVRRGIVVPEYEEVVDEADKPAEPEKGPEIKPLKESPVETPAH
jgi:hypothetical protein